MSVVLRTVKCHQTLGGREQRNWDMGTVLAELTAREKVAAIQRQCDTSTLAGESLWSTKKGET